MFNWLQEILCRLLRCKGPHRPCKRFCSCCGAPSSPKLYWTIITDNCKITTEALLMELNTEQSCIATVRPKTAGGHDARIDGSVVFAASGEGEVRFEQIDFLSARIFGVSPGEVTVTATFDADLDGDEVRNVTFDGTINVKEAEAESASMEFGEPTLVLTPAGQDTVVEDGQPVEAQEPAQEPAEEPAAEGSEAPPETEAPATGDDPAESEVSGSNTASTGDGVG